MFRVVKRRLGSLRLWDQLKSPSVRRIALLLSIGFVAAGIVVSFVRQPDLLQSLNWQPALLVLLVGVPISILLNAFEFLLSGRLIGGRIPFTRSFEIVVVGTAANILPLPGATLVRIVGLKTSGAGTGDSVQATLFVASIWFGVAFLIAGIGIASIAPRWLTLSFLLFGATASILSLFWARRLSGGLLVPLQVTLAKSALVLTDIGRMCLCFWAIGVEASLVQGSAFAVTSVVGNAASVVPAGLGVREGLSAALAPIIGITAAAGFVAAALNRLLGLSIVLPLGALLALRSGLGPEAKDHPA